ncbi:hypothetical protein HWI79_2441 [Cryptosporidium felis]|nr:hypothetical protein HWI79_2441 [Cryptosporidium felis]
MVDPTLKLILVICMLIVVACGEEISDFRVPLKDHKYEQLEFPSDLLDALIIEEKSVNMELCDHVILEKPEEYSLIIKELEGSIMNFERERIDLETIMKSLVDSQDTLAVFTREDQVQSILGGKGILELSKLNKNLDFGKDLLENELKVGKRILENFPSNLELNLKEPIRMLVQKINSLSDSTEKYLRSLQLLNVFRERSHLIYENIQIISQNSLSVDFLVSSWTYFCNELQVLFKDQLNPILDKNGSSSGNDIFKRLELLNSIVTNTVLVKYGELETASKLNQTELSGETEKKIGNTLLKELKIKPLDMQDIVISDPLINWRLYLLPSIVNIFQGPVSKLFKEIKKDIENVDLKDVNKKIHLNIEELNSLSAELAQISSKINSSWLTISYLNEDDVLTKSNEKLRSFSKNEDLYKENNARIVLLSQQLLEKRNLMESLVSNKTIADNHRFYLGLNTLKCLSEFYQVYQESELKSLVTYSRINQNCPGFFLKEVGSFQVNPIEDTFNPNEIKDPVIRSEYIISYFISIIFPNSKSSEEKDKILSSPISELIWNLETEEKYSEGSEARNERSRLVIQKIGEYNDQVIQLEETFGKISQTIDEQSFDLVKHYSADLSQIIENHIQEFISNREDAVFLLNHLFKVLTIVSEEFSEKELNNNLLKVTIASKFNDIKFLFNDYIARVNIEFSRSERLNVQNYINSTHTILEEIENEIKILDENFSQLNEALIKQCLKNISDLLVFVYSSLLTLTPIPVNEGHLKGNNLEKAGFNGLIKPHDQFIDFFRDKYRYILFQLSYYFKLYQELKEKKKEILEMENRISSRLSKIELEVMDRSKSSAVSSSTMHKIQRQHKIAEKIISGYLMQTLTLHHSRSQEIERVLVALENIISHFKSQVSTFKKQNNIGTKVGFRNILKNVFRSHKYLKLRKYYRRMKKFQEYLVLKREQIAEYLNFSDSTIKNINQEIIAIIDHYLCKKEDESNDFGDFSEIEESKSNLEPIQLLMGNLYNIFSRMGRLEYNYHSPKFLFSNSKFLRETLKQFHGLSREINRLQNKALKIFISQQKNLENALMLIRIIIPASYIIKKYNKLPKEYLRFTFKAGKEDLIGDEIKRINIRGWDIDKGKRSFALENELIVQKKYLKNEQEFHEIRKEIDNQLKEYSLNAKDLPLSKGAKTIIFLVPDDMVEQIIFEIDKNQSALREGTELSKNEEDLPNNSLNAKVHKLIKKRRATYSQLAAKSYIVKQAQCFKETKQV